MQLILEGKGYQGLYALDPEDGWAKLLQEKPDLLILDVLMPDGTEGFHLAWKVRSQAPEGLREIPILIVTVLHAKTDMRLYHDLPDPHYGPGEYLPVQGFLDKPIQPLAFLRAVDDALRQPYRC